MLDDNDLWPAYCALCDRGFVPRNGSILCDACNEKDDDDAR